MKIATVMGNRPQFIKAAVLSREIARRRDAGEPIEERLIHTGQHFDENMSDVFFREMQIPRPSQHLGIARSGYRQMCERN